MVKAVFLVRSATNFLPAICNFANTNFEIVYNVCQFIAIMCY